MFVSQESTFSVSTVSVGADARLGTVEQTVSTLPSTGYVGVTPAAGHVATDREGKWLYVANRDSSGTNASANNMAVFEVDAESGMVVDDSLRISPCGGNIPRYFKADPSNRFMLVCNQFGEGEQGWPGTRGTLAIFEIDHENGGALVELATESYAELGYTAVGLSWVDFLPSTPVHITTSTSTLAPTPTPTSSPTSTDFDSNSSSSTTERDDDSSSAAFQVVLVSASLYEYGVFMLR